MKIEIKERIEKIKNKEIPEGYRKTNIGIYPSFWQIKRINQISEKIRETSIKENLPILTISAGNGFLDQKERFNKIIAGKSLEKYTYLKKDDFSYNRGNSKSYKYGCLYKLEKNEEALVPNVYHSFRLKEVNTDYYKYLFESKFLDRQLRTLISSTARMDGLLNINRDEFMNLKLPVPPIEEQVKISTILSKWDEGISNQEKLIEAKKEYKKGMMQKIFSQKLRFKDENGNDYPEWEEKKLGETISFIVDNRGKTPPFQENGIPLIEVNSIGKKKIDYNIIKKYVSEEVYNNWFRKYLKKNDILFSTVGATGLCSIYDETIKSIIAQNIVGLRFEFQNHIFIFYLLTFEENNVKFKKIQMGAVQPSLKVTQMTEIKFLFPSLLEQEKIANFLSIIDREIELLEKELFILKNEKQSLMKMLLNGVIRTV